MSKYQRKVMVGDLEEGMYVSKLDCAWHQTPFPLQGFHVESKDDINSLKAYCKHVFVDVSRSRAKTVFQPKKPLTPEEKAARAIAKSTAPLVTNPIKYDITSPLKKEIKQAKIVYADLNKNLTELTEQFETGESVDLEKTFSCSRSVVKSVLSNPEALVWVIKLKNNANSLYQHSINCAVWAAVVGRELGLTEAKLEKLTTGVMLSKIGLMTMTKGKEVNFIKLRETEHYKKHVLLAIKLLAHSSSLCKSVLETIATHEEHYDGQGFPNQLQGEQIPLFGQIAGMVDYFESSTNPTFSAQPLSPTDALSRLYQLRDMQFSERLIEAFIQCLGLYPPGTIVELSTQEIGIVTSNQKQKRLQPDVMVIMNKDRKPLRSTKTIDLQAINKDKAHGLVEITCSLPVGTFGIEPHQYQYANDSLISRLFG